MLNPPADELSNPEIYQTSGDIHGGLTFHLPRGFSRDQMALHFNQQDFGRGSEMGRYPFFEQGNRDFNPFKLLRDTFWHSNHLSSTQS